MAPIDLNLLRVFVAVFETGSFTTAAARLGHPRSTSSRAIAALEEALSLTLFQRTTRAVRPTPEAQALYERVKASVGALDEALADLPGREDAPSGRVRITATPVIASFVLAETIAAFTGRHPQVEVEVILGARVADLVREGIDLALRVVTGRRTDSTYGQKVGTMSVALFASPRHLAAAGTPHSLDELERHPWIAFPAALAMLARAKDRRALPNLRARVLCDDMTFARSAAVAHAGVVVLPTFAAEAELAAGTLVRVLPRWEARAGSVYLLQPRRKNLPARLSLFKQALLEQLRRRPLV
jgi:DNA-binding transcriptional LysR family regulator